MSRCCHSLASDLSGLHTCLVTTCPPREAPAEARLELSPWRAVELPSHRPYVPLWGSSRTDLEDGASFGCWQLQQGHGGLSTSGGYRWSGDGEECGGNQELASEGRLCPVLWPQADRLRETEGPASSPEPSKGRAPFLASGSPGLVARNDGGLRPRGSERFTCVDQVQASQWR